MSLTIAEIISTLQQLNVPPAVLIAAETQFEQIEAEKKDQAADGAPKAKSQLVTILLDPENKLADLGDFVALVAQIPEEDDAGLTLNKLHKSVYDYRATAKKPKVVNTVVDAADTVKRKYFKENGLQIKTKEPVRVLISNNQIPAA